MWKKSRESVNTAKILAEKLGKVKVAETMGEKIRALRIVRGMTQEDLAEKMFMRKSTISAYENDLIDIKSSVIVELAKALNTLPGYFFPGYEGESPLLMYRCPLLVERQRLKVEKTAV